MEDLLTAQSIVKCEHCHKDFLFFGVAHDEETYFCSPECTEEELQGKVR